MTDGTPALPDWSRLAGTYWYVPPESLPAMRLDTGELAWMEDQTVWHLTGCQEGYLWGVCATLLWPAGQEPLASGPGSQPAAFTVLGSITPEGRVYLAFIPQSSLSSGAPTIGVGRMVPHGGAWSFEMQMSSGSGSTVAHWAYMMPVASGDPAWDSLPGCGVSVPAMLEGCKYPTPPAPVA